MKTKIVMIGCVFLVIGIIAGYFIPRKLVQWQLEKQSIDYFENNDVNLPFQTYTSFGYENIIANAAPWTKQFIDENMISNIEKTVRNKYAYLFDAAINSPKSENDIVNYLKVTGLLNKMNLSVIANTLSDSQGVFNFYRFWIFSSVKFSCRIFSLAKGSDSKKVAIGVLPKQ